MNHAETCKTNIDPSCFPFSHQRSSRVMTMQAESTLKLTPQTMSVSLTDSVAIDMAFSNFIWLRREHFATISAIAPGTVCGVLIVHQTVNLSMPQSGTARRFGKIQSQNKSENSNLSPWSTDEDSSIRQTTPQKLMNACQQPAEPRTPDERNVPPSENLMRGKYGQHFNSSQRLLGNYLMAIIL